MAIQKVFKSTIESIRYIFKDGKHAAFVAGKYVTEIENEIKELMDEIKNEGRDKSSHPHLYVDPTEKEIDTEAPSPIDVIKAKAVADYIASQADSNKDLGNTGTKPVLAGIGTTKTIAAIDPSVPNAPIVQIPESSTAASTSIPTANSAQVAKTPGVVIPANLIPAKS